jgi:hypothetical protein
VKKIILSFVILIIFSSCNTFTYKKINIDSLNNEIIINDENKKSVYGLYCKINGKVNDVIEIELTNNDTLLLIK